MAEPRPRDDAAAVIELRRDHYFVARTIVVVICLLMHSNTVAAQEEQVAVNVDVFNTAESDTYMEKYATRGAFGKFMHYREVTPVDIKCRTPACGQAVIRMNRDTLYSIQVVDLDASPATVVFPENGDRFVSLVFISENHDVFPSFYVPGSYQATRNACYCEPPCRLAATNASTVSCSAIGTRYLAVLWRTLVDAGDAADISAAHALQDKMVVQQEDSGAWDPTSWDQDDLVRIRTLLLELKATSEAPTTFGFFSGPDKIDHLYGVLNVAAGWGGVRPEDQTYFFWTSASMPEAGRFVAKVPVVPVIGNGMWSITVYNDDGFMFADPSNYNSAAQGSSGVGLDGVTTVYFGGCDDTARQQPSPAHCLPVEPGWNIAFRIFRPATDVLNGAWDHSIAMPAPELE